MSESLNFDQDARPEDIEDGAIIAGRPISMQPDPPYEGAVLYECGACDGGMWLGPRTQQAKEEAVKRGIEASCLCMLCVVLLQKIQGFLKDGIQALGNSFELPVKSLGNNDDINPMPDPESPEFEKLLDDAVKDYNKRQNEKE